MSHVPIARFAVAALWLSSIPVFADPLEIDLPTALDRARRVAPAALAARGEVAVAQGAVVTAELPFLDNPEVEIGAGPRLTTARPIDAEVRLEQDLELGRRSPRRRLARAGVVQVQAELDAALRELDLEVSFAFYDAVFAERSVGLAQHAEEFAQAAAGVADRRRTAGEITDLDANLARSALGRARAASRAAQSERATAVGRLGALIGAAPVHVRAGRGERGPAAARAAPACRAPGARGPDARVREAERATAAAQHDQANASALPQVSAWASYQREDTETIVLGGLRLSLPVWNRAQGDRASAAAKERRAIARRDATVRAAERDLRARRRAGARRQRAAAAEDDDGRPARGERLSRRAPGDPRWPARAPRAAARARQSGRHAAVRRGRGTMTKRAFVSPLVSSFVALLLLCGCSSRKARDGDHAPADGVEHAGPDTANGGKPHAHGPEMIRIAPDMMRDLRVTTGKAQARAAGETISALGELRVNEDAYAEVAAPVTARVTTVRARPGDLVKAGQALAALTSPALVEERAALDAARSRLEITRKNAERKRALVTERLVPEREAIEAESTLAEADAAFRVATSALRKFGSGAGEAVLAIRSPIAGTVIDRSVVQGQLADPSKTLFRIGDLSLLWLHAHVFERDAVRVQTERTAAVTFAALPGRSIDAVIKWIGREVDASSRTIDIRLDVPNRDGVLRPGMSATVSIPLGDAGPDAVVTVPVAAVQRVGASWAVFIPHGPAEFAIRSIGRGRDLSGEVEVLSGLVAGDEVVVDGAFLLKAEADKASGGAGHED